MDDSEADGDRLPSAFEMAKQREDRDPIGKLLSEFFQLLIDLYQDVN